MQEAKFFSVGNYFNMEKFDGLCKLLEEGLTVEPGVNCIGHTRNNMVQEDYKEALEKKYGDKLNAKYRGGVCSYGYTYSLVK